MRRRSLTLSTIAVAALALPVLTGCGSSGTGASGGIPSNSPSASPSASATCVATGAQVPSASTKVGSTPKIAKPTGPPPCALVVKDLKVGSGTAVNDTSTTYNWNYEGVSWSTGQKFDSSFDRGQPAAFALSQVIPGWTEGLQGMKPGGRRLLVIPPDKAYGAAGQGAIGPNETLVFVVDLVGPATG